MLKYERATFRILVGDLVQIEVSVCGCHDQNQTVTPAELREAARLMDQLGRSIKKIKLRAERQQDSKPATSTNAVATSAG